MFRLRVATRSAAAALAASGCGSLQSHAEVPESCTAVQLAAADGMDENIRLLRRSTHENIQLLSAVSSPGEEHTQLDTYGVQDTSRPSARSARGRPLRILITGFHDWRELEGNVWRCRDNPSCSLIYGAACPTPPIERRGPLVTALAAQVRVNPVFAAAASGS